MIQNASVILIIPAQVPWAASRNVALGRARTVSDNRVSPKRRRAHGLDWFRHTAKPHPARTPWTFTYTYAVVGYRSLKDKTNVLSNLGPPFARVDKE